MKSQDPSTSYLGKRVVWIDEDRRISIHLELVETALDLKSRKGDTAHIWGLRGAQGQLQLLSPESELSKLRDSYQELFGDESLPWAASGDEKIAVYRRLAGFFRMNGTVRGKKLRLTLPAEIVDLDQFRVREAIVIFSAGQIVELWGHEKWQVVSATNDLRDLTRRARELLEDFNSTEKS